MRTQILQQKIGHEESLSKMDNEIKEDEDKKFNLTLRNLEQKIKILEESREQVQKNNIEL